MSYGVLHHFLKRRGLASVHEAGGAHSVEVLAIVAWAIGPYIGL